MSELSQTILFIAQSLAEGELLLPKEFLHLGTRAAIDQSLTRLTKEGHLLRVGRGMYARPVPGRFGVRPPSAESVVQAIEASSGELVVASGAAEANALGLTTQVPSREIYLTSGPTRQLHLGKRKVELKHGTRGQMLMGKRPAGKAIRALLWLGQKQAPVALQTLRSSLEAQEWEAMRSAISVLPSWMARAISEASVA